MLSRSCDDMLDCFCLKCGQWVAMTMCWNFASLHLMSFIYFKKDKYMRYLDALLPCHDQLKHLDCIFSLYNKDKLNIWLPKYLNIYDFFFFFLPYWYHNWKTWVSLIERVSECDMIENETIIDHSNLYHTCSASKWLFSAFQYFIPHCYWFVQKLKPVFYPWLDALGNKWHQDCEVCQPRLGICSRINEPNHSQQPADWNPIRGHEAGAGGSWKESAQYGEEKGTRLFYKSQA